MFIMKGLLSLTAAITTFCALAGSSSSYADSTKAADRVARLRVQRRASDINILIGTLDEMSGGQSRMEWALRNNSLTNAKARFCDNFYNHRGPAYFYFPFQNKASLVDSSLRDIRDSLDLDRRAFDLVPLDLLIREISAPMALIDASCRGSGALSAQQLTAALISLKELLMLSRQAANELLLAEPRGTVTAGYAW